MSIAVADVAVSDVSEIAESGEVVTLDDLFERLERMPVPEGYKVEVVEGAIYMSPQRDVHWDTILAIIERLRTEHPRRRVKSDMRFDFPGEFNGLVPDVALLSESAQRDAKGRFHHRDLVFVAEVISRGTGAKDYGPKKAVYASTGLPAYLVADPF